jgi:hypothetical protein
MDTNFIDDIIKHMPKITKIKFESDDIYMRWRIFKNSMDVSINTPTSASIDDIKTIEEFKASLYENLINKKGILSLKYLN